MSEIRILHRYIQVMEQKEVNVSRVRAMGELITEYCQKGPENKGKSLEIHVPDISRQRHRNRGNRRRHGGGGGRRYNNNHQRRGNNYNNHQSKRRRQY